MKNVPRAKVKKKKKNNEKQIILDGNPKYVEEKQDINMQKQGEQLAISASGREKQEKKKDLEVDYR